MVLTQSGAKKYFGDENPIGQVINWNNNQDYTVTGLIADPVHNSHLDFDILASFNSLLEQQVYQNLLTTVFAFVAYNYIKLEPGADITKVDTMISNIIEERMGEGMRESGTHFEMFLQPVRDIHLHSALVHELSPNGNQVSVGIFSAISLLILLIACINFVNLTTARSTVRSMEIGIRMQGPDQENTLESIGNKWNEQYPEFPFNYFFQEEFYDDLYREDHKMGNLFIYFTILAILISVMGLFGLILFTSVRRTREIGIRTARTNPADSLRYA